MEIEGYAMFYIFFDQLDNLSNLSYELDMLFMISGSANIWSPATKVFNNASILKCFEQSFD